MASETLDHRQQLAAQLVAEDELGDDKIAERVRITTRQLRRWKQRPDFRARVAEISRLLGETILRRAIARKASRIRAMDERWAGLQQIIEERAVDPAMLSVRGGSTGLIIMKQKGSGIEYVVDHDILKAMLDLEKQAAQELGQWQEKIEIKSEQQIKITDEEKEALLKALYARLGRGYDSQDRLENGPTGLLRGNDQAGSSRGSRRSG